MHLGLVEQAGIDPRLISIPEQQVWGLWVQLYLTVSFEPCLACLLPLSHAYEYHGWTAQDAGTR